MITADSSECIAHSPIAHKVACKVLAERMYLMGKASRLRENDVSCAGRSLLEMMQERLVEVIHELLTGWPDGGDDTDGEDMLEWGIARGRAEGIAWCIALIINPYRPNVDAVKEEAMEAYEEKYPDPTCVHCGVTKGAETGPDCTARSKPEKGHKWEE